MRQLNISEIELVNGGMVNLPYDYYIFIDGKMRPRNPCDPYLW